MLFISFSHRNCAQKVACVCLSGVDDVEKVIKEFINVFTIPRIATLIIRHMEAIFTEQITNTLIFSIHNSCFRPRFSAFTIVNSQNLLTRKGKAADDACNSRHCSGYKFIN